MNALAAHVLAEDLLVHCHRESFQRKRVHPQGAAGDFYSSLAGDDNYFPVVDLSEDWKSLYLTWNMAFILGELSNLHYLFPKLLIPSVLCSRSENFLGARIISLWISINSALLLNFNHVDKLAGPEHRREMAVAWGEINQRHAETFYEAEVGPNTSGLLDGFHERFSRPYTNLANQVLEFVKR